MDISGITNLSVASMGVGSAVGGSAAVSAPSASQSPVNAAMLSGVGLGRMDQLLQLVKGFSMSEVMLAMMLTQPSHHAQSSDSTSAASGLQLGLLLAGQGANQAVSHTPMALPSVSAASGSVGAQLSLQG